MGSNIPHFKPYFTNASSTTPTPSPPTTDEDPPILLKKVDITDPSRGFDNLTVPGNNVIANVALKQGDDNQVNVPGNNNLVNINFLNQTSLGLNATGVKISGNNNSVNLHTDFLGFKDIGSILSFGTPLSFASVEGNNNNIKAVSGDGSVFFMKGNNNGLNLTASGTEVDALGHGDTNIHIHTPNEANGNIVFVDSSLQRGDVVNISGTLGFGGGVIVPNGTTKTRENDKAAFYQTPQGAQVNVEPPNTTVVDEDGNTIGGDTSNTVNMGLLSHDYTFPWNSSA